MSDWAYFGLFFLVLLALVGVADLIRRALGWSPEVTRKSVHVITGLLVACTPFLFASRGPIILLAGIFTVINFVGIRFGLFQGMHGTGRPTYGTVFYPLAFIVLLIWFWDSHPVAIIASMLVLAVADAAAAIVGENLKHPHEYRLAAERKSVEGSATMFFVSFGVIEASLLLAGPALGEELPLAAGLWAGLLAAAVATVCEAVSVQGSDNLTAPLGAALVLQIFLDKGLSEWRLFTLGCVLAAVVALVSYRARFLDASGAALTFILGTIVFGLGGWTFTLPILVFFFLSSLLSKAGRRRRSAVADLFQKSGRRDVAQVLANGGIAAALLLAWYFAPGPQMYFLYLASLAAVTADTWATEIGVLVGMQPRSVVSWRPVPIGSSGGVTLAGLLAALLGGLAIGISGKLSLSPRLGYQFGVPMIVLIAVAGLLASLVDSLLGATLQAQYRCRGCGKVTEKVLHCGLATTPLRGFSWMNNDVVNGVCAASGAVLAWLMVRSV